MRIALGIEYDGTSYNGWQRQKTGLGVQQRVEEALSVVANDAVEVICAGRTDTGVHATGQVVHFDTESERSERGWLLGANTNLPDDISVTWVKPVDDDFHARFSAMSRRYRYLILNRLQRSALHRHRAWWVYEPLDAERMHAAAQRLLGEHDFSAFRAAGCQANTAVRQMTDISVASRRLDDARRDGQCIPAAHGAKYHGYACDGGLGEQALSGFGRPGEPRSQSGRDCRAAARADAGRGRIPGGLWRSGGWLFAGDTDMILP